MSALRQGRYDGSTHASSCVESGDDQGSEASHTRGRGSATTLARIGPIITCLRQAPPQRQRWPGPAGTRSPAPQHCSRTSDVTCTQHLHTRPPFDNDLSDCRCPPSLSNLLRHARKLNSRMGLRNPHPLLSTNLHQVQPICSRSATPANR